MINILNHTAPDGTTVSEARLYSDVLEMGVINYGARSTYIRHRGTDLTLFYSNPLEFDSNSDGQIDV